MRFFSLMLNIHVRSSHANTYSNTIWSLPVNHTHRDHTIIIYQIPNKISRIIDTKDNH